MDADAIYLRRRARVLPIGSPRVGDAIGALGAFLGSSQGASPAEPSVSLAHAVTVARNFESLGYALVPELIDALATLSEPELTAWYEAVFGALRAAKGADRVYAPMYAGFPREVIDTPALTLYANAIVHYWSDGRWLPPRDVPRMPLLDDMRLIGVGIGSVEDFECLFTALAGGNASLSPLDVQDLEWFVARAGDDIERLLPVVVPQRETRAILGALLLRRTTIGEPHVTEWTTTATDVLRLAVALCGGDVSLAEKTRFSFNRPHRRLLLALLDRIPGAAADMRRHREAWKRLGHSLHAGEHRRRYPSAFAAVDAIRGASSVPTERTPVEAALRNRDLRAATRSLASRPGDFARRLDHLLRLDPVTADSIIDAFAVVADGVSTPVLLSVAHHFAMRTDAPPVRVFFPKGITAKAHMANDGRGVIDATVCQRVVTVAEQALLDRFAVLPPMGRVYVDPALLRCPIPHAGRSASASSRSLARGTRLPLPPGGTVRFFVWWRDGEERTDIDLSAVLYSADLRHLEDIAYYNLKTFGGHHSGDIVAAPDGASEFVDLDLAAVAARGARYIGMVVTVFTGQQFKQLPECTAGWMIRTHAGSGEVYDPRTVVDRLDIGAASRIAMPLLIDVTDRSAVWCDLSVRSNAMRVNAAFHNRTTLSFMIGATIGSTYPSLHRLMSLHAQARGLIVGDPAEADITFTLAEGFPFQVERIADSFLA